MAAQARNGDADGRYADRLLPAAGNGGEAQADSGVDAFVLHPALLDAAVQPFLLHRADAAGRHDPDAVTLPTLWSGVTVHASGATGV